MRKNTAGQVVTAQLNAPDGMPVITGTTIVSITGDLSAQSVGLGVVTHMGKGLWRYEPSQADTNYEHVVFTFENALSINQSPQVFTTTAITADTLLSELVEDDGEGLSRFTVKALENSPATGGTSLRGEWKWSSSITATDPLSGIMKVNHATLNLATELYISSVVNSGYDAHKAISELSVGDTITLAKNSNTSNFIEVLLTAEPTDNDGWYTVQFTVVEQAGTFGNNNLMIVGFRYKGVTAEVIATTTRVEMDSNSTKLADMSTFDPAVDIVKADNVKINGKTITGDGVTTPFDVS